MAEEPQHSGEPFQIRPKSLTAEVHKTRFGQSQPGIIFYRDTTSFETLKPDAVSEAGTKDTRFVWFRLSHGFGEVPQDTLESPLVGIF